MKASDECTWQHPLRYRAVCLRDWYGRRQPRLYFIFLNLTTRIRKEWTSRDVVSVLIQWISIPCSGCITVFVATFRSIVFPMKTLFILVGCRMNSLWTFLVASCILKLDILRPFMIGSEFRLPPLFQNLQAFFFVAILILSLKARSRWLK